MPLRTHVFSPQTIPLFVPLEDRLPSCPRLVPRQFTIRSASSSRMEPLGLDVTTHRGQSIFSRVYNMSNFDHRGGNITRPREAAQAYTWTHDCLVAHKRVGQLFRKNTKQHSLSCSNKGAEIGVGHSALCCPVAATRRFLISYPMVWASTFLWRSAKVR